MNALEKYQTLAATDPPDGREILAAWDVVERMRERGYRLTLHQLADGRWRAVFTKDVVFWGLHYAQTAPDAILGAATAAMESEGR
jgi:hypothetical protein